jgi:hypothetical protein
MNEETVNPLIHSITTRPQGDKSSDTDKQKEQAAHIEAGYECENRGSAGVGCREQAFRWWLKE